VRSPCVFIILAVGSGQLIKIATALWFARVTTKVSVGSGRAALLYIARGSMCGAIYRAITIIVEMAQAITD
jgi:hypothetical protein